MAKNAWLSFLAAYRKKNPSKSMKQAMKDGAKEYKKSKPKASAKGKKKKVSWDNATGGAIDLGAVTMKEAPVPEPRFDPREMPQDQSFLYADPKFDFYQDAYDYRPQNIIPMYAYEPFLSSRNEAFHRDALKEGLSGFGARRDDHDIVRATVHSLKRHPDLLQIYMEGAVWKQKRKVRMGESQSKYLFYPTGPKESLESFASSKQKQRIPLTDSSGELEM